VPNFAYDYPARSKRPSMVQIVLFFITGTNESSSLFYYLPTAHANAFASFREKILSSFYLSQQITIHIQTNTTKSCRYSSDNNNTALIIVSFVTSLIPSYFYPFVHCWSSRMPHTHTHAHTHTLRTKRQY